MEGTFVYRTIIKLISLKWIGAKTEVANVEKKNHIMDPFETPIAVSTDTDPAGRRQDTDVPALLISQSHPDQTKPHTDW